jgi:hypothetical protein
MPTIFRLDGYRFYFYSHEPNEPPHVHVDKGGASMKVWLEPVAMAKNTGFRRSGDQWHNHHGSGPSGSPAGGMA